MVPLSTGTLLLTGSIMIWVAVATECQHVGFLMLRLLMVADPNDLDDDGQCMYYGFLFGPQINHRCPASARHLHVGPVASPPAAPPLPPMSPLPPSHPPPRVHQAIVVSGQCPHLALYGGTYTLQGIAGNDAPYYRNAASYWLYHDLDCSGNGSPARWILDEDTPDGSRSSDLDNDGQCAFAGVLTTADAQPPLGTRTWYLNCDGSSFTSVDVTLATVSPSPPAAPPLSPLPPLQPPPWVYQAVVVSGMCPSLVAFDGPYTLQGMAGNGAPFYRHAAGYGRLYCDLDCDGNGAPARWILDDSAPDGSRSFDLDNDGWCTYRGDLTTADAQPPLGTRSWFLDCDGSWGFVDVTLAIASPSPPPASSMPPLAPASPPPWVNQAVVVSGLCPDQADCDGTYFLQGMEGNGAPYYRNAAGRWLYYDLDCSGNEMAAQWILDTSAPDSSRSSDLDNDRECLYAGVFATPDAQPPLGTKAWNLLCDGSFTFMELSLATYSPSPPPRIHLCH
eukprot:6830978-Prymnesium_polylepis.3